MKIRFHLVLLVLGTLVPILVSIAMLVMFNRQRRKAIEKGLVETARALSVAVDQQVEPSASVLKALATSAHLRRGNLREFDWVARERTPSQR